MKREIGDLFQTETKYHRGSLEGGFLDWTSKPETYKHYRSASKVQLEAPEIREGMSLWQAIGTRRSIRNFSEKPMKKDALSGLLWASQGITNRRGGFEFRAAPSAGALYPVETYCVIHNVEDISPGVFHYDVRNHHLEQLSEGNHRNKAARAALDQDIAYSCSVLFIWSAIFNRSKWKYKQRAFRYVYLDAGHIAGNLSLAAVALGLGSCQIAALYDEEANELLGIDGKGESVIYMTAVGYPRS